MSPMWPDAFSYKKTKTLKNHNEQIRSLFFFFFLVLFTRVQMGLSFDWFGF